MKPLTRAFAFLLLAMLFIRIGNSCAYAPDVDVFVLTKDPDAPYAKYAAGRLGIVPGTYRIRHLVVAYRTLSGHGLSPAEQQAAAAVDKLYDPYAEPVPGEPSAMSSPATPQLWTGAPGPVTRLAPGQKFESFDNCLVDAFSHATATVSDRRARYGKPGAPDTPEIADWVAGQQAVFSNCGEAGQMPKPAPADAPQWLRQDRAYQLAAAQFYNLDYDAALTSFRAIAADLSSPWSPLARYLVARVYIRQALVPFEPWSLKPEQLAAEQDRVRGLMTKAREQLTGILAEPAMKPMHPQASRLLDYVMARLEPTQQASELARRLTVNTPAGDPNYTQNVVDLSYIYNQPSGYAAPSRMSQRSSEPDPAPPLIRWLDDFGWPLPETQTDLAPESATRQRADALNQWRANRRPEWLVAALNLARPGDAGTRELSSAAAELPLTSPAYASATYQRLRLSAFPQKPVEQVSPATHPVYTELAALMPHLAATQPPSTVNQFASLLSRLSPSLDDYLRNAPRHPAALKGPDDEIEAIPAPAQSVTLCGVAINAPQTLHLDEASAVIFNQRMPLRMLRAAALSPALPPNIRFQLAHMAWTRALLLGDTETARTLSPYLAQCQPALAPWLDQYNAAHSAGDRQVLGLLALMRFSSTEPVVRAGLERDFAAYDEFRDNWWCSVSPPQPGSGSPANGGTYLFMQDVVPRKAQPDPPFLTSEDRSQAEVEIARLGKIPIASDYFAKLTLAWVADHPDDARNADLLGFTLRVVRNACRSGNTKELNHQLFDLLHRRYPDSAWAKRYTTWE